MKISDYKINTYNVHGLKVTSFEKENLLRYIKDCIVNNQKSICYGYSFGTIPYFKPYPEIAQFSNKFEIMVCDGRWFYWFCRFKGFKICSKISIPEMTRLILELADNEGYSVLILGSTSDNNKRATENLKKSYPSIKVLDGHDGGFFTNEDNKKSIEIINGNKPDILLIGVSCPKKEKFAFEFKEHLNTKIIVPCGGFVDIISGKSKPMPPIIKNLGLAFLYRFIQEPKRLFKDSILHSLEGLFIILPLSIIKGKKFSIPKFYHKKLDFSIE